MSRKTLQNVHAKFGKFFFFYRIISRDAILQVFDENKIEYNAERLVVVSEPIVSFLGSEVNLSYTHRLFYWSVIQYLEFKLVNPFQVKI